MAVDYPMPDGSRLRDHLLQVERITGERDKRLDSTDPPESGTHLWNWYWELNTTRTPGNGISYTEIESYARLHSIELSPWELDTLRSMDIAYLNSLGSKHEEQRRQERAKSNASKHSNTRNQGRS